MMSGRHGLVWTCRDTGEMFAHPGDARLASVESAALSLERVDLVLVETDFLGDLLRKMKSEVAHGHLPSVLAFSIPATCGFIQSECSNA